MSKYLVNHQNISPENFLSLDYPDRKVKALFLPFSGLPEVICDDPKTIKTKVFSSFDHMHMIPLHPYFHMYVDQIDQIQHKETNLVATYIYRHSLRTYIGINSIISISGNVLIFGSVSSKDEDNFHLEYSVPYELIEQVARYYDSGIII